MREWQNKALSLFIWRFIMSDKITLEHFTEEEKESFKLQIEEWKQEHFGAVYMTEIKDVVYIWRGLTKKEHEQANEYYDNEYDRAEFVCRKCVLSPIIEDWSIGIDGYVPERLTESILDASGFTLSIDEVDKKIKKYSEEMMRFDNQMICIIKEVYQDISIEEIEMWQFDKILWYYSRAMWTLETLRGIKLERED